MYWETVTNSFHKRESTEVLEKHNTVLNFYEKNIFGGYFSFVLKLENEGTIKGFDSSVFAVVLTEVW